LVCNLQRKAEERAVEAAKAAVEARVEAADYTRVEDLLQVNALPNWRLRVPQVEHHVQR
jgi:hypothetical protein